MNFKKVLAGVAAGSMVAAMAVAPAFADDHADGVAYLNINRGDWGEFEKTETTATVTGDGTYTVSLTAAEAQDLGQFNALEIQNGDVLFGHDYVVTVNGIKINGADVALQGDSYTCTADGKGETTRVNLYNEWNTPDAVGVVDEKLGYADQRGNGSNYTAKLLADDALKGVTSIEVTFTVSGLSADAPADDNKPADDEKPADNTGDVAPVAYLAAVVALAGVAMVASKKARA